MHNSTTTTNNNTTTSNNNNNTSNSNSNSNNSNSNKSNNNNNAVSCAHPPADGLASLPGGRGLHQPCTGHDQHMAIGHRLSGPALQCPKDTALPPRFTHGGAAAPVVHLVRSQYGRIP